MCVVIGLVLWPLMNGLLHLLRGGTSAGESPIQSLLYSIKCNIPPVRFNEPINFILYVVTCKVFVIVSQLNKYLSMNIVAIR